MVLRDVFVGGAVALLDGLELRLILLDAALLQLTQLLVLLLLEGAGGATHVVLQARELAVDLAQQLDQLVARLDVEVDGADVLGDLGQQAVDLALDLGVLGIVFGDAVLLFAQRADLRVLLGDALKVAMFFSMRSSALASRAAFGSPDSRSRRSCLSFCDSSLRRRSCSSTTAFEHSAS